mmetsp:Transcript_9054/g.25085  ORF Transcript_9054/g.25085 Transcript_9054/m.25085 type:complete len:357 (+) Transcript_9054:66-1136(+)
MVPITEPERARSSNDSSGNESKRVSSQIKSFRTQSSLFVDGESEPSTTRAVSTKRSSNSPRETESGNLMNRSLKDKLRDLSRAERQKLLFDRKRSATSKATNNQPEATPVPLTSPSSLPMSRHIDYEVAVEDSPQRSVKSEPRHRNDITHTTLVNQISLHVYDLISKDTMVMVPPCGCVLEVGQCFTEFNSAMQELGTGAYHVGVEINGIEYAYGAGKTPGKTGVFTCYPKRSPGYQYRTTIDLGMRPLVRRPALLNSNEQQLESLVAVYEQPVDAKVVMKEMAEEYLCTDYDLLRKNCCSFACDACQRLGVPEDEIPSWFSNLAQTGAITQDVAMATVIHPISSVLSNCEDPGRM